MWGADLRGGSEVGELRRGVAESFLRPVGQGCEEVPEDGPLFVHGLFYQKPGGAEIWNDVRLRE